MPQAAATSSSKASGHSKPSGNTPGVQTSHAPAARPQAAIARAVHVVRGLQTVRIAMRPNANGSTVCAAQVVNPAAITVPASRSLRTSW